MNFDSLITNKRVIFVGPSRILEGSKKGIWIDSFDTVIRTNGGFPVQEKYKEDYGTKGQILYVNVSFSKMRYPLPCKQYKENGLEYICFKAGLPNAETLKEYTKYVNCRSFMESIKTLSKYVPGLLSGSAALHDILQYNPKELFVTGMDFYLAGMWEWDQAYFDNYLPQKTLEQAKVRKAQGKLIPHDVESNKNYMISLYNQNKILFDDEILKIVNLYKN